MRTRTLPKCCVRQWATPVSPGCCVVWMLDQSVVPKGICDSCIASKLQIQRRAQIVVHRRQALERGDDGRHQFRRANDGVADFPTRGEIAPFQILDQFVLRIVAAGWTLEALSPKAEMLAE